VIPKAEPCFFGALKVNKLKIREGLESIAVILPNINDI
jgi:hypothetical protein